MRKILTLLALLPALASAQVRPPPGVPSTGGTFTGPVTFTEPITTPGVTSTGLTSTRGITSSALLTPVNGTFTATTGTLNNGSYCYRVTARNAAGETLPSTETCLTVSGGASSNGVIITWGAVTGAADYVVEGRTTGAEQDMAVVTAPTVTWTDNGSVTPSGAMPTEGTSASITTPSRVSALRIDSTAASGAVAFRLLSGSKVCLDSSETQCFWFNGTAIRTDGNFIGNGTADLYLTRTENLTYRLGNVVPMTFTSNDSSDGSAIAFDFNAYTTLTTAGDLLLRLKNATVSKLEVGRDGSIRFAIGNTSAAPTCDATQRNKLWIVDGGTGVTDTVSICLKAVADTYSWVTITTGG
jgi:hypothetical protein